MDQILNYIKPELIILIFVLYFIGLGIKKSNVKDKLIPFILGLCGVILAILYVLGTSNIAGWQDGVLATFTAITQGILCAGCSVYVNQIIKQNGKEE